MGLLSGFVGDETVKDEYGLTQADRRQPLFSGLLQAGMLGMAAGDNITAGQRAQLLGQMGGAIAGIPEAMQKQVSEAAQMQLKRQQYQMNQQKFDQMRKIQAYAQTPEFAEMMKGLTPAEQFTAKVMIESGDADGLQRLITGIRDKKNDRTGIPTGYERDPNNPNAIRKIPGWKDDTDRYKGNNERLQHLDAISHEDPGSFKYWAAWDFLTKDQKNADGTVTPKTDLEAAGFKKPTFVPPGGTPQPPVVPPGAPPGAPGATPPAIPPNAPVTPEVIKQVAATMNPNEEKMVNGVEVYMDREGRTEWDTGTQRYRLNRDGTVAALPALKVDAQRENALIKNNTTIGKVDQALSEMGRLPDAILGAWAAAPDAYLQRRDPEGQKIRDLLVDLSGVVIHDRSGAAVSEGEMKRLGFLPQKTDTPQIIKQRLEAMKKWVDEENRQHYLTSRRDFQMPPAIKERYRGSGGGGGAPPPKVDGTFNPKTGKIE